MSNNRGAIYTYIQTFIVEVLYQVPRVQIGRVGPRIQYNILTRKRLAEAKKPLFTDPRRLELIQSEYVDCETDPANRDRAERMKRLFIELGDNEDTVEEAACKLLEFCESLD